MYKPEPLIATSLRIPESLKAAAQEEAARSDRSFSKFVSLALAEKLGRRYPAPPTGRVRKFSVTITFEFAEEETAALSLAKAAVTRIKAAAATDGAANITASLSALIPDQP